MHPTLRPLVLFASAVPVVFGTAALLAQTPQRPTAPSAIDAEFFEKRVRPLLAENCFACHTGSAPKGGLKLDTLAGMMKGGTRGPILTPGKPESSLLIDVLNQQVKGVYMPPKGKLSDEQIAILSNWIKRGAPWPGAAGKAPAAPTKAKDVVASRKNFWSFLPIRQPAVPSAGKTSNIALWKSWVKSPIDAFILKGLEAKGAKPAPAADRRTLLRRVTFDLTGLPPTPDEVEAFVADKSPDAYTKVVERLLASPAYGERWGRHWLDLVRYAETDGHEFDFEKPGAYHYRDYVIRALNADVPFNQFVLEHIAGDMLKNPRQHPTDGFNESIIGTGFWWMGEGKHSPVDLVEDLSERVDNQIDVMSKAFMGLSLGCARCHDHKFDPISTKDFYALYGYLKSSRFQITSVTSTEKVLNAAKPIAELNKKLEPALVRQIAGARLQQIQSIDSILVGSLPSSGPRVASLVGANEKWNAYLKEKASKNPADPFHAWAILSERHADFTARKSALLGSLNGLASRANAEATATTVFEDFAPNSLNSWFRSGVAFGSEPIARANIVMDVGGKQKITGYTVHAASSFRVAASATGAIRSRSFKIERNNVHLRMAGKGVQARLIIDHFQRIRYPIYGGLEHWVNTPTLAWHRMDVSKWKGHTAYFEFLDDGPVGVVVDKIVLTDSPSVPEAPSPIVLEMLARPEVNSIESLAKAYRETLSKVVSAWISGERFEDEPRAELMNSLLKLDIPEVVVPDPEELKSLLDTRGKLESAVPAPISLMASADGTPENEPVHIRGSHKQLGDMVPRRFLEAFGGKANLPTDENSGRLALAERMVNMRETPIVPRVIANRVWHHHFGRGIVPTTDDFGFMGERPTNQALLDWLALELAQPKLPDSSGKAPTPWSLKHLHRIIVASSTYKLASRGDAKSEAVDPQNKLLHRANIRRMEAEGIRDSILAVSGRLDRKMYGPGILPHLTQFLEGRGRPGKSGPIDGEGRRTVYQAVRRNFLTPMFLAFDFPVPFNCMGRRNVSNVPAQALTMMNNAFVVEQAGVWAKRVLAIKELSASQRVEKLYMEAFARPATEEEKRAALQFLDEQVKRYTPADEGKVWADLCHVLFNVKEFIYLN